MGLLIRSFLVAITGVLLMGSPHDASAEATEEYCTKPKVTKGFYFEVFDGDRLCLPIETPYCPLGTRPIIIDEYRGLLEPPYPSISAECFVVYTCCSTSISNYGD